MTNKNFWKGLIQFLEVLAKDVGVSQNDKQELMKLTKEIRQRLANQCHASLPDASKLKILKLSTAQVTSSLMMDVINKKIMDDLKKKRE